MKAPAIRSSMPRKVMVAIDFSPLKPCLPAKDR